MQRQLLCSRVHRRLPDDVEVFARAKEALPGDLDLTQRMLGGLDRLLQITRGLMCLPNWELGTLEGSNRRFEGFGKL